MSNRPTMAELSGTNTTRPCVSRTPPTCFCYVLVLGSNMPTVRRSDRARTLCGRSSMNTSGHPQQDSALKLVWPLYDVRHACEFVGKISKLLFNTGARASLLPDNEKNISYRNPSRMTCGGVFTCKQGIKGNSHANLQMWSINDKFISWHCKRHVQGHQSRAPHR